MNQIEYFYIYEFLKRKIASYEYVPPSITWLSTLKTYTRERWTFFSICKNITRIEQLFSKFQEAGLLKKIKDSSKKLQDKPEVDRIGIIKE